MRLQCNSLWRIWGAKSTVAPSVMLRFRLWSCLLCFRCRLDCGYNSGCRDFKHCHWLRRGSNCAFCERWTHEVVLPRSGWMCMKLMITLWIMEWGEKGLWLSMKGAIVQSWCFVYCSSANCRCLVTDSYTWNLLLVNVRRAWMIRDLNIAALRGLDLTWLLLVFCHRYICRIVIIQRWFLMLFRLLSWIITTHWRSRSLKSRIFPYD